MKKYYQYFGLALIMVFSFYYTEKISLIVLNKNPLMKTINEEAENYNVKSVNAEIMGEYITPGINGIMVNTKDSYYKMQELDTFNKYYLVFDQVEPDISVKNNKDKIIKNGNLKNKQISLILEEENELSNFLKSSNIKASLLVNLDTYKPNYYFEPINNEESGFKTLENNLNLNKENKKICVINNLNFDICKKFKNYLIEPLVFNQSNYIDIKKELNPGSIILISKNVNLSELKLLIKEINYKDLEIVYLSELISEENKSFNY